MSPGTTWRRLRIAAAVAVAASALAVFLVALLRPGGLSPEERLQTAWCPPNPMIFDSL